MVTRETPAPVRIRQAALSLFAAQGFDGTGIRDIAVAAGIPTSLLYHYRRSKQQILRDLVVDGLSRHLESSRRALALAHTPEEGLRTMISVHVLVPMSNPDMARVLESEVRALSPASQAEHLALRAEGDERWENVLRAGAAEGVFEVPDVPLARALLRRMCTGVWHWYRPDAGMPVAALVEGMLDHALGLVHAARAGAALRAPDVTRPALAELREIVAAAHSD